MTYAADDSPPASPGPSQTVRDPLSYLQRGEGRAVQYAHPPPDGEPWETRGSEAPTALRDHQDEEQIRGVARFVPHAAFAHPRAPADAPARLGIEARCLVLFDELPGRAS